jgi:AraC-like DNA-binding protein
MTLRLVTHAGGYLMVGEQRVTLKRGQIFCAIPGVQICFGGDEKRQWGWYEIQLLGPGARRVFNACGMTARQPIVTPVSSNKAYAKFKAMHQLFDQDDRQPHQAMALLHHLVDAIGYVDQPQTVTVNHREHLVDVACALHESQTNLSMNVNEFAHFLGVDRVTLQRAFKAQLNMSPSAYINRQRIFRAKELLTITDWPQRQIALSCGYANEKYFIRAFRQATDMTPGQYRQKSE